MCLAPGGVFNASSSAGMCALPRAVKNPSCSPLGESWAWYGKQSIPSQLCHYPVLLGQDPRESWKREECWWWNLLPLLSWSSARGLALADCDIPGLPLAPSGL